MEASKGFFVVRDVEKIEGKRRFAGDLIIKGRVDEPDDPRWRVARRAKLRYTRTTKTI